MVQEITRRYGVRDLSLRAAVLMLTVGFATVAMAAGGGAPDLPPPDLLWTGSDEDGGHALPLAPWIIDFVLFVTLLIVVTKGPFKKIFQTRHDTIKSAVEAAASAHRDAAEAHKTFSAKLEGVAAESASLLDEAKQLGADEKTRIVEGAKAYGARLEADAGRLVEQEFVKAGHTLKVEAAEQAVDKAQELIKAKLGPEDHQRFFELALEEIRSGSTVAQAGGNA